MIDGDSSVARPVGISVVIVNWNGGDALLACVGSLAAEASPQASTEVIVVDNASSDGSAVAARDAFPWLTVIDSGANLGFAAGANLGSDHARGEVIVFVNPDARVAPGAVAALVGALAELPGAGIAGGGLVDPRGRWQPGAARFGALGHLVLDTTLGRLPTRLRTRPYAVDWVYGTFMAVRHDLFRRLGGFDRAYFLYGEDMDLCHRAAEIGARTIHVPAARAVHGANLSATQRYGSGREAEVVKGELRFYGRRRPHQVRLFRAVAACKFGTKAALAAVVGRSGTAATYGRVVRACFTAPA
ncbi:MAG TPA: glycosyltransferase family 2 protein [Candidatus Binatia bacterium]|nr:glycosyltransferase family 2 protein [Candidatus Binatia bacterium]